MNTAPNLAISLAAGLLSFLSPCILPLIPSYLSFIGGASLQDLREDQLSRRKVFYRTLMFVLGFSLIFIVLGVIFSSTGFLFAGVSRVINAVAGIVVIILGLNIMFDFWKFLNFERKIHVRTAPKGLFGAFLIGMAFGGGWTPCVGPILAGILFLSGQSGQVGRGILSLAAYSLGLGIPFLLAGIFFGRFVHLMQGIKRHLPAIRVVSGLFLIGIGLLIALGRFQQMNAWLGSLSLALRSWAGAEPLVARVVLGTGLILVGLIPFLPALLRKTGRDRTGRLNVLSAAPVRLVLFTVTFIAGMLGILGIIDLPAMISSWLSFQGI